MYRNLTDIDWSKIPEPENDGAVHHLMNQKLPNISLTSTDGNLINLSKLKGKTIIYAYPRTGRPDTPSLVKEWDMIPGAKGCTPQSCAFRDHFSELKKLGVTHLFGLSTQDTDDQAEAVNRLHLPFPILSDQALLLTKALNFPTFDVNGKTLLKRFTMVLQDEVIEHVFYPVFPPDQDATNVIKWLELQLHPSATSAIEAANAHIQPGENN